MKAVNEPKRFSTLFILLGSIDIVLDTFFSPFLGGRPIGFMLIIYFLWQHKDYPNYFNNQII